MVVLAILARVVEFVGLRRVVVPLTLENDTPIFYCAGCKKIEKH